MFYTFYGEPTRITTNLWLSIKNNVCRTHVIFIFVYKIYYPFSKYRLNKVTFMKKTIYNPPIKINDVQLRGIKLWNAYIYIMYIGKGRGWKRGYWLYATIHFNLKKIISAKVIK